MAFLPADILDRLQHARQLGRIPHAMLITGSPGSGRANLARDIAALVNSVSREETTKHPDIHTLEPGSKSRRILVENFRDFCQPFFSTSFRPGATKTGIIFDADRLQTNAANAFLKTLEEPPDNTLFILVTSNPGLLPVTIVSRCAHFPLRAATLPPFDEATAQLAEATGAIIGRSPGRRTGSALLLARHLQHILRDARALVEDELTKDFKDEIKRLGDTADEQWIKDEESRLKALIEARALAVRQRLVDVVAERIADVLRVRHGLETLRFPALALESARLGASLDDAELLRILDGAARLRLFLSRNLKEDLALEAGCLALAQS